MRKNPNYLHECIHELNIRNGELQFVINPPYRNLGSRYVFINSSFSKSDSIVLTGPRSEISLRNREYTEFYIEPEAGGDRIVLGISDGIYEHEMVLSYIGINSEYSLVISKKSELEVHSMSYSDFKNRDKTFVEWSEE